ncbi:MAG: NUDIX domain-containing protein [bacterium]|nr:NUDIX domain-containing protein [bacterium]
MPHIHEKVDFTVEVFVVCKNKVLLRLHDKYKIWLSVGGHIELDEEPNQAAVREVKEEVGLDITLFRDNTTPVFRDENYQELVPPKFLNFHSVTPIHRHVTLVYFARSAHFDVRPEKPDDQWKWVSVEELDEVGLKPSVKFYAERALKELGAN